MHPHFSKIICLSAVIPFFVLSCVSTRNTANLPPPKSVVLYASDAPEFMRVFAKPFTTRMNTEKVFSAQENQYISEDWVENSVLAQSNDNKKKFASLIADVKNTYQTRPIEEAKATSQTAMAAATQILLNSHASLANEYAELAFWVAVVNFDDPTKLTFPANVYVNLTSKRDRLSLENETSPKIVSLIEKSTSKGRYIKLKASSSCSFYGNGKLLSKTSFRAIPAGNNVLTAHCSTGDYAHVFNPEKTDRITVTPVIDTAQNSPSPAQLPISEIDKLKVDSAVLIYYSNKDKYIEANVYDAHAKKFTSSYKITMNNDAERKDAGNLLIKYLKGASSEVKESIFIANKNAQTQAAKTTATAATQSTATAKKSTTATAPTKTLTH